MKKLAMILFVGSILSKCLGEDAIITNEYWIESNTNGLNQGTIGNPFWGNNQATFDALMSKYVGGGNVVIHLLAGTYYSDGGNSYFIGPNTTISGSGMNATIVKCALIGTNCDGVWIYLAMA